MATFTDNLPIGEPSPDFEIEAVVSGRVINPREADWRALVLLFFNQKSSGAVANVQDTVRPVYPSAADVAIASVIDLSGVPRMFRGMAKKALAQGYEEASHQIPDDWDPVQYVVLLPDWKGEVAKAYGIDDLDEFAAVVVIDAEGKVVGSYRGEEPGQAAVELLNGHFGE